jgi:hypothetical protein
MRTLLSLLVLLVVGCGAIRATQTSGPCEPPCEPARRGAVEAPLPRPADDACIDPDDECR